MALIILRTERKRYKGLSPSGKSHKFLSQSNGGTWFNIQVKATNKLRYYEREYKGTKFQMIEITFEDWVLRYGQNGIKVETALKQMKTNELNQVII